MRGIPREPKNGPDGRKNPDVMDTRMKTGPKGHPRIQPPWDMIQDAIDRVKNGPHNNC